MKRFLLAFLILFSSTVWAGRFLPQNMQLAVLKEVNYPEVTLAGDGISWIQILTLGLLDDSENSDTKAGIRLRDDHNRFMVKNRLPRFTGQRVGVIFDNQNKIQEIWILTDREIETLRQRKQ